MKRIATTAWAWALIVLICSCRALASPPSHDQRPDRGPLLTWAHRVPYVSDRWTPTHCFWLSNDRLLVFDPQWAEVLPPYELDLGNGAKHSIDAFNRKMKAEGYNFGGEDAVPVSSATLSPDHQWIICFDEDWSGLRSGLQREHAPLPHRALWWALRLDGTRAVTGYSDDPDMGVGAWSAQSDAWITFTHHYDQTLATYYSLAKPDQRRQIPIAPSPAMTDTTLEANFHDWNLPILNVSAQGHGILRTKKYHERPGVMDLFDVDLETGKAPTRHWVVRLPDGAQCYDVVMSLQGDRLAWLFAFKPPPPDGSFASRMEIWKSRLDGGGMQRLGYQPVDNGGKDYVMLSDLRWLPDGKHVSFVTHISSVTALSETGLYTIPVAP
jgi:hypothetical protein